MRGHAPQEEAKEIHMEDEIERFIQVHPTPWEREVIVSFRTLEIACVLIQLKPFSIGKYPVTNQQYYRFLNATGYGPHDQFGYSHEMFLAHWGKQRHPPADRRLHPVTFVSFDDALAYAQYMQGRLPTYHEWLYAAFGHTTNRYPWGDIFSSDRCNVRESHRMSTTPVGSYSPKGDSLVGCADMLGNVWEWTSTFLDDEEHLLMALGTGWDHYSLQTEILLDRGYRNHSVGFRIVRDLVP